jgi:hypothetical protein
MNLHEISKLILATTFYDPVLRFLEIVKLAEYVAQMGEKMKVYRILAGKPEGKRPLGKPRHRWVNNIKKGLR